MMQRIQTWIEMTEEHVSDDWDLIVPVIGDVGVGKSTLILQIAWRWQDVCGKDPSPESVIEQWPTSRPDFQNTLAQDVPKSVIMMHDATRLMQSKKAMRAEQIELEEDLFDARFGNHLILLGYQQWKYVPNILIDGRAKQCLYVPRRGTVYGFKNSDMLKREENGYWPEPRMRDFFPDLEGTRLWHAFRDEDQRRKQDRMEADEDEDLDLKELAEKIGTEEPEKAISLNGNTGEPYFDKDLIEIEYDVSKRQANQVAKLLKRDFEPVPSTHLSQ